MLEETYPNPGFCNICGVELPSDSEVICSSCENESDRNFTEIDKTETHEIRDKKGGWKKKKCTIKIRKTKSTQNYKLARILQEIETLKKEQSNLRQIVENYRNEIKDLKWNLSKRTIMETRKRKPISSSTPNYRIQGRKSYQNNDSLSPITPGSPRSTKSRSQDVLTTEDSNSESETESQTTSEETSKKQYANPYHSFGGKENLQYANAKVRYTNSSRKDTSDSNEGENVIKVIVIGIIVAITAVASYSYFSSGAAFENPKVLINLDDLKHNFPHQAVDTWNAIQSGIYEVKILSKPSVFLLIYDDRMQHFLNAFIRNISGFASCILNDDCTVDPVVLMGKKLGDVKSPEDYGYLISKFRPELEEKSVMVIHNLEEVPGRLAQAFHSFCDEYNPLVRKSVYFFTMKMDNSSEEGNLATIERTLRRKWSDLKDDIFDPLFTRISSMVILLEPEEKARTH